MERSHMRDSGNGLVSDKVGIEGGKCGSESHIAEAFESPSGCAVHSQSGCTYVSGCLWLDFA